MSLASAKFRGCPQRKPEYFIPSQSARVTHSELQSLLRQLHRLADPAVAKGAERFGIKGANVLGITAPRLRALAKTVGTNQELSLALWPTGFHEARALAALIGDPALVSKRQMERWVRDFDNWAVCDACCAELFIYTSYAGECAFRWSSQKEEFVKRAGFVMMASMAVHLKRLGDDKFIPMLRAIKRESTDERNFVRKAVNWALRQIGKRNSNLNLLAILTAGQIGAIESRSARWIASDALRELESAAVRRRLQSREKKNRTR
ncbi:MAG TPA: DNA alkylation repair protein [Bacteroidetes bacterium]|nr:DNA alkylation repair protein [Bacteroidota bacterium]